MRAPRTKGLVLHGEARYYDVLAWLLTLGRERAFRERLVELAALEAGETVLDVGCGTGSLAIAAKRRVRPAGTVHGIDASPEMIDRARRKAAKEGVDVIFHVGAAETLPFPDACFDAVTSTLMLHHLPRALRQQCAREMLRVLKPGGRVLAADFTTPARQRKGFLARLHRHGHVALDDMVELLREAGLHVRESGAVGVRDLQFAVAVAPGGSGDLRLNKPADEPGSLDPPARRWMLAGAVLTLVAAHGVVLRAASSRLALPALAATGAGALAIAMHSAFAGVLGMRWRRRSSAPASRPLDRD